MTTKTTKQSKAVKKDCDTTSCGDTIKDLQTKIDTLVDLSTSFSNEIQNIMTSENLSFSYRSSLLGTATKNFVEQVEQTK